MAQHLDLEEQEQLDQLKHFWKSYGDLITWVLIAVLGAYAAWNGYQYWQRNQAMQSAALFDEVDRAVTQGDVARLERAFGDMKDKFGSTIYARQAALLAAKVFFEKDKIDASRDALSWVVEKAPGDAYAAIARLRLAGVLVSQKAYDEALGQLAGEFPKEFQSLVADRRGDILSLQGKGAEAIAEYKKAYSLLEAENGYRRLVEVKLAALGVDASAVDHAGAPAGSVK